MADASLLGGRERRTGRRVLFVFALLAVMAGAAIWLLQPKQVAAVALFQVDSSQPSLLADETLKSGSSNYEIFKNTQVALLKSKFVLESALRNPRVGGLAVFGSESDPVGWLQDHLEVGFPENSEILEIKLRGQKSQADDLVRVIDSVAAAYQKEVIGSEKSRQLVRRDLLERSLQNLSSELKRKYEDYLDIAKGILGTAEDNVSDIQQQLRMKRLERIEEELSGLEREVWRMSARDEAKDEKLVAPIKQRMAELQKRQQEQQKAIEQREAKSVELITRKQELEQLQRIANELSVKLEQMDIDAAAPYRIRQIQPATITPGIASTIR